MRALLNWPVAVVMLSACGVTTPVALVDRQAIGETKDTFPSWAERGIHYMANRARADPQADLASCTHCGEKSCYSPKPPLGWSYELARSARFHSANLSACGAFSHDSPCTLVPDLGTRFSPGTCDGSPACACQGGTCGCAAGGCTDTWQRIGLFNGGGRGENIASGGTEPAYTHYLWLHENAPDPACAFSLSNGHRWNILTQAGNIGVGCAGHVCTQDFGGPGELGKISVGTHSPQSGTVEFMAHWFDTAPPAQRVVNLDGTCLPLTKERGVAGENSTWVSAPQQVAGCKRYFFTFTDSSGLAVRYPTTGSLGVGCANDWEASAPPMGAGCGPCTPSCAGKACGDDGCGGQCAPGCGAGEQCQVNACVSVCAAGQLRCGSACVNPLVDVANCGRCGRGCTSCVNGECARGEDDAGVADAGRSDAGLTAGDAGSHLNGATGGCGATGGTSGLLAVLLLSRAIAGAARRATRPA